MANSWNLRPMWDALLDIHAAIRNVCREYGIQYWVCGGTALGAMRHKGFIPWDDDFDIMMLRPDYERFWKVASRSLPSNLSWVSYETDRQYPYPFGKVKENRPDVVEKLKVATNLDFNQGLYIDVFPVDGQPDTLTGLKTYKQIRQWIARIAYHLPLPRHLQRKLYFSYFKCLKINGSKYCGVACADRVDQQRCYWPTSWFRGVVEVPFDRDTVPMVKDPLSFIQKHYRCWQELPPEENRVPSHQMFKTGIVDF